MAIYTQTVDPITGEINERIIRVQDSGLTYWVPNDDNNVQWLEYQAWLAQGNQPNPPDSPAAKDSK